MSACHVIKKETKYSAMFFASINLTELCSGTLYVVIK